MTIRFLWVDLQLKAICDAYDEDRTLDRVPRLLDILPEDIKTLYMHALQRALRHRTEHIEIMRKVFSWVICAKRPLSLHELDEAITVRAGQQSWKEPSIKFTPSTLSKRCGNLIVCDDFDDTVSIAHHSVRSFLDSSNQISGLADMNLQVAKVDQYLGETCITYLNFTNFQKILTTTSDSKNLQPLSSPLLIAAQLLPRSNLLHPIGLWNKYTSSKPNESTRPFDVASQLRYIRGSNSSVPFNSNFPLFDYCRTFWHHHYRDVTTKDSKAFSMLKAMVLADSLPFQWAPWEIADDLDPFPYWQMLNWAVRQAHLPILKIWRESVSASEASESMKLMWSECGDQIFSSACIRAEIKKIDLYCNNMFEVNVSIEPTGTQISNGMIDAAALGHIAVVQKLLQQNANIDATSDSGNFTHKTALQAAAGGGHLAVVEYLLQENADVNAAVSRYGETALQAAAAGGHLAIVERLLQQNADVNATVSGFSGTALQAAAGGGHLLVVERLLQQNADVNAESRDWGRTALQAAAEGGHINVVERLLQQNAKVNASADDNIRSPKDYEDEGIRAWMRRDSTALQAAAGGGHLAVVERLLRENADVNASAMNGRTALQAAAEGGHVTVVECLLRQKAKPDATNRHGFMAIHLAVRNGHLTVIECLLQHDNYSKTILSTAAEGRHLAMTKQLLKHDANLGFHKSGPRPGYVKSVLQAAAGGGHLALVDDLLQEGADINNVANAAYFGCITALQEAAEAGHLAVVERLVQQKADVNAAAGKLYGRTALQAAAGGGHLAVVGYLLQHDADINANPGWTSGRTALQAAAEGGHLMVVKYLLQQNADINAAASYSNGRTALQAAAEGGHLVIVKYLLQQNADINAAASETKGRTALQAAAEDGHLTVVKYLLQQNANVNAAGAILYGRTALQAAAEGGHLAVVQCLLQHKADVNAITKYSHGVLQTALQLAIEGGYLAVANCLRAAGAVDNRKNGF